MLRRVWYERRLFSEWDWRMLWYNTWIFTVFISMRTWLDINFSALFTVFSDPQNINKWCCSSLSSHLLQSAISMSQVRVEYMESLGQSFMSVHVFYDFSKYCWHKSNWKRNNSIYIWYSFVCALFIFLLSLFLSFDSHNYFINSFSYKQFALQHTSIKLRNTKAHKTYRKTWGPIKIWFQMKIMKYGDLYIRICV